MCRDYWTTHLGRAKLDLPPKDGSQSSTSTFPYPWPSLPEISFGKSSKPWPSNLRLPQTATFSELELADSVEGSFTFTSLVQCGFEFSTFDLRCSAFAARLQRDPLLKAQYYCCCQTVLSSSHSDQSLERTVHTRVYFERCINTQFSVDDCGR